MQTFRNGTVTHLCDTCYRELDAGPRHDGLHFCGTTCATSYKSPIEHHCPACNERVATGELICWNCKGPLVNLDEQEGVAVSE